jgi:hypothetical protein
MANYTAPVRFNQNQLITPVVHNAASAPNVGTETPGQIYYNTDDKLLYFWNGARWVGPSGAGAYQQTIGNGSATAITVTHNLGTTAVNTTLYELPDLELVQTDITVTGSNSIRLTFGHAPATDSLHVVIFAEGMAMTNIENIGPRGPGFFVGHGLPGDNYSSGDTYLDMDSGNVYAIS